MMSNNSEIWTKHVYLYTYCSVQRYPHGFILDYVQSHTLDIYIYIYIYLSTAIGLTPGGSVLISPWLHACLFTHTLSYVQLSPWLHVCLHMHCSVFIYPHGFVHVYLHTRCSVFRYPHGYMHVYLYTQCSMFSYPHGSMLVYLHMRTCTHACTLSLFLSVSVMCSYILIAPCVRIYKCTVMCSVIPMVSCPIKYKEMCAQQTKQTTGVVGNREA